MDDETKRPTRFKADSMPRICHILGSLFLIPGLSLLAIAQSPHAFSDIQVISPDLQNFGDSAVQFEKIDGGQKVKIAPEIHVHKNFFSGTREIQGPIISGGPTVVVARHPKTNEQMYVELTLPPGAPKIAYTKNRIEYVFAKQRISVKFWTGPFGGVSKAGVSIQKGQGIFRTTRTFASKTNTELKRALESSPLVTSAMNIGSGTKELVDGTVEAGATGSAKLIDGIENLANKLPFVQPLKSLAAEKPQRQATSRIDQLFQKRTANESKFFKSNR